jgi:hypothetical protein
VNSNCKVESGLASKRCGSATLVRTTVAVGGGEGERLPRWTAWTGQGLRLVFLSSWGSGGAVRTAIAREGVKEKATKVDSLGWAGTKVSMFSSLGALAALYVLLKMREGVKEKATKVDCLGWART